MPNDHIKQQLLVIWLLKQQLVAILVGMIFRSSQITLVHGKLSPVFNHISIKIITNIFPHIFFYVISQMYKILWALSPKKLASNST